MLGMIKSGAADRAGVRQGDELLRVDGQEISSLSPFKVAGLLQGADSDSDSDGFVELEASTPSAVLLQGQANSLTHSASSLAWRCTEYKCVGHVLSLYLLDTVWKVHMIPSSSAAMLRKMRRLEGEIQVWRV